MSISAGGINLVDGVIDAQYRIAVLERVIDHIVKRSAPGLLTQEDISRFQNEALVDMQQRYPNAGIEKKQN